MPERTETLIADDQNPVRQKMVEAVRNVFPELNVHEAGDLDKALSIIEEIGERLHLVVSDGKLNWGTSSGILDGERITRAAHRKGVPHIVLYSSAITDPLKTTLETLGITCIDKPISKEEEPNLENWLRSRKGT